MAYRRSRGKKSNRRGRRSFGSKRRGGGMLRQRAGFRM